MVAVSPYPRQMQNAGAPFGFVEAGASDLWVPRGYAHVIANLRGTGGSEGTDGIFDAQGMMFTTSSNGLRRRNGATANSDKG